MGQMTAIDPNSHCDGCDDQILNDPNPVTANVTEHTPEGTTERACVWHEACVPEDIKMLLELEGMNTDG